MPNTQAKKGLFQFYPHNLLWLGLSVLAIVLDQWTKWIASTHLNYADPVPVLPFLNWTLLHNYGAAFSFLSDAGGWQRYLFTSLAGLYHHFYFWLMRMPKKMIVLPWRLR
jgi:signal peptidase II